jgi:hypothetical protein
MHTRNKIVTIAAATTVVVAIGGAAMASDPTSGNTFTGCVNIATGYLRVIDTSRSGDRGHCITRPGVLRETQITWNQQGVPGPTGSTGPQGPAGPAGTPGTAAVSTYLAPETIVEVMAGTNQFVHSSCNPGDVAISRQIHNVNETLLVSIDGPELSDPTEWTLGVNNVSTLGQEIILSAVCLHNG